MNDVYKEVTHCRFCGSNSRSKYLDLLDMPLVNNLLNSPNEPHVKTPIRVMRCNNCTMSYLDTVVDPKILYSYYTYRSGMSNKFKQHCQSLANGIIERISEKDLVVDIAANDGTFLECFQNQNKLGIEPATNLCAIMKQKGISYVNEMFDSYTTKEVIKQYGKASVITAMNVFAHIGTPYDFLQGAMELLKEDSGLMIIEVPWVRDMVKYLEFDCVYQEHLSYISVKGMVEFINTASNSRLEVKNVETYPNMHGGSLRFYISWKDNYCEVNTHNIDKLIKLEKDIDYEGFQSKINNLKEKLLDVIGDDCVTAIGAAAKGCVMANYFKLKDKVKVIFDNTPEKWYKFQPGTGIPILPMSALSEKIDVLKCYDNELFYNIDKDWMYNEKILIFPWNISSEIIENVRKLRPDAKFIVPIPKVKEI